MKKSVKILLISCLSLTILAAIIIPLLPFMFGWKPAYGAPSLEFPFEQPDNIIRLGAYNTPDWGAPGIYHNGIDLIIENTSTIVSPCYGTVTSIESSINEYKGHIMIGIDIQVNRVWTVKLGFEPYSNDTAFHEYQLSLIVVKVGQKLSPGDEVGSLLNGGEYPHIHYSL